MEITGKNPFVNVDSYIKRADDKKEIETLSKKTSRAVASDYKEDNVELSAKIRELREAKKILYSISDIRDEKVEKIKKRIENGTYQIEGEKIAVKMIRESLLNELL